MADGGDALRHLKVLEGQPELFGQIASAATANRTIIALTERELVVEELADAIRAARQQVWEIGGANAAEQASPTAGQTGEGTRRSGCGG